MFGRHSLESCCFQPGKHARARVLEAALAQISNRMLVIFRHAMG